MFTSNITFNGKDSYDYFSAALFDNSILQEFEWFDSQQNSLRIPRVTLSGHTQPGSCSPGATGSIVLDPAILNVCAFGIYDIICRNEVEPTYLSVKLPAGANNDVFPNDFARYIMSELMQQVGNNMQNVLWNGNDSGGSGYLGECDGLLVQALADSSVIDVAATASAITSANVQGELARVYTAVPAAVKSSGRPWKIYVSQDIADAYLISQGPSVYGLNVTEPGQLRYAGIPVVVAPFIGTKKMFATWPKNIVIGTDLRSDMSNIMMIPQINLTGHNKVIIAANWKFGVTFKLGSEIVLYA